MMVRRYILFLFVFMCWHEGECQCPAIEQVLHPVLRVMDTVKNYRISFTERWKPVTKQDTFTHNRVVLLKRVDGDFHYKVTDDLQQLAYFKDSLGFCNYSSTNRVFEANEPEENFVYLGYKMLDPGLREFNDRDFLVIDMDTVSDPVYNVVTLKSRRDTLGCTNNTYTLWLNRKTSMIDKYVHGLDYMKGHQ